MRRSSDFQTSQFVAIFLTSAGLFALALTLVLSGCGGGNTGSSKETQTGSAAATNMDHGAGSVHSRTAHTHIAPHGGQVQSVGENHFELTFATNRFTLYVLGEDETKAIPIAEKAISLQLRDDKSGQLKTIKLESCPLEGEPTDRSSRFTAAGDDLENLVNFDAVVRVPLDGEVHRVSFQFIEGKPISAGIGSPAEGFACPMACEKEKIYKQTGKCPVCKMKLEEHKSGATAHADHNPKHGGIFFMAPDNWHHLEGTLVSSRELRIYLYDNFTKPLAAAGYAGELKLQPVNDQDDPRGDPVTVAIRAADGKPYLVAELPESTAFPFQSEARLQFPNAKDKYLFNFDFKGVQHKE